MKPPGAVEREAVLRVGDGRGFVIETEKNRLVVTAGHCVAPFPPFHSASSLAERMRKVLGRIGQLQTVWAECLFADPIADLAILGSPDNQAAPKEADAFSDLVLSVEPLPVGDINGSDLTVEGPPQTVPGWLLSLEGEWFRCLLDYVGGPLWVSAATNGIRGGMSGSPILREDGRVVGVVSVGAINGMAEEDDLDDLACTEGGPNPRLSHNLPAWLVKLLPLG